MLILLGLFGLCSPHSTPTQKKQYLKYLDEKPGCLTTERVGMLKEIDFDFGVDESAVQKKGKKGKGATKKSNDDSKDGGGEDDSSGSKNKKNSKGWDDLMQKKHNSWIVMLDKLKQYRNEHGNCIVPRGWPDDTRLANWVATQRSVRSKKYPNFTHHGSSGFSSRLFSFFNRSSLSLQEGIQAIDGWQIFQYDARTDFIVRRYRTNRDSLKGPKIITFPFIDLLTHLAFLSFLVPYSLIFQDLEFAWNAQEAAWSRHMSDLKKFAADKGHCRVPPNHSRYPKLREWVTRQQWHYVSPSPPLSFNRKPVCLNLSIYLSE